jgi:hypothetical protein
LKTKLNVMLRKISQLLIIILVTIVACKNDDPPVVPDTPEISTDVSSIDFGSLDVNQESAVQVLTVTGLHLKGDVTIAIPSDFKGSLVETGPFGSDDLTINQASLEDATVAVYLKATPSNGFEGALSGNLTLNSTDATEVPVALSATVALVITGTLFTSEYFEEYGTDWITTMPLDSGIMGWNLNTDTVMNQANSGGGYPVTTVPNNEVYNTWYLPVPLLGATLRASLGLSSSSDLAITGYPAAPMGARNIVLDPADESQYWNWINKNNGLCKPAKADGNNTSAGRRFAADGYTDNVFMSALVNISALGEAIPGKPNDFGKGDIIALANATSGPSNNNTIKVVALSDDAGGFKFGLLKENEGNTALLSTTSYSLNTTYAIVLSHEFVDGDNNDISKLYIFAEGEEIPTSMAGLTPVVTMDASYTEGVDPIDLCIIYMRERRQSVVSPTANVTGIRVGSTWIATLFEEHDNAQNSNDLTLNNRVLTNKGSDCTP